MFTIYLVETEVSFTNPVNFEDTPEGPRREARRQNPVNLHPVPLGLCGQPREAAKFAGLLNKMVMKWQHNTSNHGTAYLH